MIKSRCSWTDFIWTPNYFGQTFLKTKLRTHARPDLGRVCVSVGDISASFLQTCQCPSQGWVHYQGNLLRPWPQKLAVFLGQCWHLDPHSTELVKISAAHSTKSRFIARPSIIQVGCPTCCYEVCALNHAKWDTADLDYPSEPCHRDAASQLCYKLSMISFLPLFIWEIELKRHFYIWDALTSCARLLVCRWSTPNGTWHPW